MVLGYAYGFKKRCCTWYFLRANIGQEIHLDDAAVSSLEIADILA